MDGEVMFVVSDIRAMMAFMDFAAMISMVTWVESVEEMEELLPRTGGSCAGYGDI
jgi:hypothetical protein